MKRKLPTKIKKPNGITKHILRNRGILKPKLTTKTVSFSGFLQIPTTVTPQLELVYAIKEGRKSWLSFSVMIRQVTCFLKRAFLCMAKLPRQQCWVIFADGKTFVTNNHFKPWIESGEQMWNYHRNGKIKTKEQLAMNGS